MDLNKMCFLTKDRLYQSSEFGESIYPKSCHSRIPMTLYSFWTGSLLHWTGVWVSVYL